MSLDSEELRGRNAKDLLDNKVLREALELVKKEVFNCWLQTPTQAVEEREAAWRMYRSAEMFESVLLGYIQSGHIARREIERLMKEK
jgi:hypothetical protein